jgi:Cu2+-exporting ATPase
VHLCAALTFLGWWLGAGAPFADSLLIAASVLIITCPCALALAVPAVQVIATARLLRSGLLLKSPTALERLAEVDTVVFDKTGTLTEPSLALEGTADPEALSIAATLAAVSRHPLARALVAAAGPAAIRAEAQEEPGRGIRANTPAGEIRLGSAAFCGVAAGSTRGPDLWLARPGAEPARFSFCERVRSDARWTIERLRGMGLRIVLASGDREPAVAPVAAGLGIAEVRAGCGPADKVALLEAMRAAGRRVMMVGDGLNDSAALAAAHVSAAPASGADISQTMADVVYQGERLRPATDVIALARRARSVIFQNIAFSIGYNALALPLAVAGLVTPWLAAAAMSTSSLVVILNSSRLHGR